jgi:AraC-like DNA-binding protein
VSISSILLLGAAQAAFLVALIVGKKNKTLPDAILAGWIVVLGIHHLLYSLLYQGIQVPVAMLNLNSGIPLVQGPFLYLYVDTLTSGRRRLRPVDALHFLPFLCFSGYVTLLLPSVASASSGTVSVFHLSGWITAVLLLSVPVYAVVALLGLRRHAAATLERYSERHGRDLAWLRKIVIALLLLWAVVIATTLTPPSLYPGLRHQMMIAATVFVYAIGYFGWRQFAVMDRPELEMPAEEREEPLRTSPKYERSGLKAPEIEVLIDRLTSHLELDRPYLEPGVTLMQIARNLGTTSNHLSQAINQGLNKNFHELINQRRVEDFKGRVLDSRNQHRNLLAVAFDSGFSSKSSFNRVFKQLSGLSPKQYLDRQAQKNDDSGSAKS